MSPTELRDVVGANLRRRRIEKEISQRALGDLVGLSGAQINRIENGGSSLPVDLLAKLGEVLDEPPLYFLTERRKPSGKEKMVSSA